MRKMAAALAVATLAGLLGACSPFGGQVPNPPDSPGSTTGPQVSATSAARLPPESVPPYVLALTSPAGSAKSLDIAVRASMTGQVLAVVRPPGDPGTFTFVSDSAGDGRTFLVGAQPWKPIGLSGDDSFEPVSFYLLRFDPASGRTSLTALPVPAASIFQNNTTLVSAVLSPDGSRLAVAGVEPGGRVVDVHVYPLPAGGAGQTWTVTGTAAGDVWGTRLSWSANDRVLAVGLAFGTVRLLDTAVPPGRAAAVEDITLGVKDGYRCFGPVLMTSDGRTLVCGVSANHFRGEGTAMGPGRGGFAVYDIRTGDLTAVLGTEGSGKPAPGNQVPAAAWVSPRGTLLIGQPLLGRLGMSILRDGHYQPVAWTSRIRVADPTSLPVDAW
jgi:hypothetical protein